MKSLVFVFVLFIVYQESVFSSETPVERMIESVKSVCHSPKEKYKYWGIEANGGVDAKVKLKILNLGVDSAVEFTQKEWEGVQGVLREHQARDNDTYRRCVEKILPLFIGRYSNPKNDLELIVIELMDKFSNTGVDLSYIPPSYDKEKIREYRKAQYILDKISMLSSKNNLGCEFEWFVKSNGPEVGSRIYGSADEYCEMESYKDFKIIPAQPVNFDINMSSMFDDSPEN